MKSFALIALPLITLVAACGDAGNTTSTAGPVAATTPPAGTEWVTTVSATTDGGYVMGNPNAPIKLVEYGSLSCSHCAEFSEAAMEPLKTKYIASGKVSYEFRSYLLGGQDVAPTLLVQCGGPATFFGLLDQVYADQKTWLGKLMALSPADQQRLQSLPPPEQFAGFASATGLDTFVNARGLGSEEAAKCLTDIPAAEKLVEMRNRANEEYKVAGTPTFLINGQVVSDTANWEMLEPKLKAAGA